LDVRLATALAWVDLWQLERDAEAARETQQRRERLLATTQERLDTGTAPRLDVLRARAEATRARAEATAAVAAVAGAVAQLAVWLGPEFTGVGQVSTAEMPTAPQSLPPLGDLLARLDRHPALLRAMAHLQAGTANVVLERRRRWPLVGLDVGASFGTPLNQPPALNMYTTGSVQDLHAAVSVELPVFHVHGPLIARAQAMESQAQVELAAARVRLAAELARAYAAFQAANERARALNDEVLPAAQEAADLALESYRSGHLDIAGVLAAEQTLTDARNQAQHSIADRARALHTLEHAVGGPL
jgi:cobalt-zinc-cadmium efflux system outer membrane protein